ncbi:His/Glu/Gln/Arg/opine family amino ABC transporter, permease, 3-TM region [Treponema denticola SP33]|uniref:His/Glu/Gln/Arg/opine family amino ABC transporter, permease, 3-TM region n=1 Tax=Treponema denticola SP33 TaxID=999437 RepID=M2B701_TREDN|nr:His/Glu/Gln/Arg/opine family amino ABC transporter, permease, 3-TM region [Treponema denticola SP33]EPF36606.1 His/Glu/Gln/Arg/opine family amino ABC transporter, permease, 3-TM region [Treponema denticola SP32]
MGCIAFLCAFVLGLLLEILRNSKIKIIKHLTSVYISFFRSTPYITQLFIFYFGLPQVIIPLRAVSAESALVITIAMNSSAFIAETIRGGLLSVDKGQKEAALSIGMSSFDMMKEIILPQAFVASLPSLGNAFVGMIKSTAVGFTIGVVELLSQAKMMGAAALNFFESYVAAGIVYWLIIIVIDHLQKKLEKRVCKYL